MSRAIVVIRSQQDRSKISTWAQKAPSGTRVEFKSARRTLPQNDRMWAMLTDVAEQLAWYGQKLKPDEWKLVFLDALNREIKAVPSIDGRGFVNIGTSSSDLSKGEMSDLMEVIAAFGAEHDVVFKEVESAGQAA